MSPPNNGQKNAEDEAENIASLNSSSNSRSSKSSSLSKSSKSNRPNNNQRPEHNGERIRAYNLQPEAQELLNQAASRHRQREQNREATLELRTARNQRATNLLEGVGGNVGEEVPVRQRAQRVRRITTGPPERVQHIPHQPLVSSIPNQIPTVRNTNARLMSILGIPVDTPALGPTQGVGAAPSAGKGNTVHTLSNMGEREEAVREGDGEEVVIETPTAPAKKTGIHSMGGTEERIMREIDELRRLDPHTVLQYVGENRQRVRVGKQENNRGDKGSNRTAAGRIDELEKELERLREPKMNNPLLPKASVIVRSNAEIKRLQNAINAQLNAEKKILQQGAKDRMAKKRVMNAKKIVLQELRRKIKGENAGENASRAGSMTESQQRRRANAAELKRTQMDRMIEKKKKKMITEIADNLRLKDIYDSIVKVDNEISRLDRNRNSAQILRLLNQREFLIKQFEDAKRIKNTYANRLATRVEPAGKKVGRNLTNSARERQRQWIANQDRKRQERRKVASAQAPAQTSSQRRRERDQKALGQLVLARKAEKAARARAPAPTPAQTSSQRRRTRDQVEPSEASSKSRSASTGPVPSFSLTSNSDYVKYWMKHQKKVREQLNHNKAAGLSTANRTRLYKPIKVGNTTIMVPSMRLMKKWDNVAKRFAN
jgi:hypothetical protein